MDSEAIPLKEEEEDAGIQLNPNQQKWLKEVEDLFIANMYKRNFTQEDLGTELHLSKRQLSRRIKSLTGLTTNNYLKEIRLTRARRFLEEGTYGTVSEVSYAVGFEDQHYFSKQYKGRFGRKPISYFRVEGGGGLNFDSLMKVCIVRNQWERNRISRAHRKNADVHQYEYEHWYSDNSPYDRDVPIKDAAPPIKIQSTANSPR